jgi:hypothetical protein
MFPNPTNLDRTRSTTLATLIVAALLAPAALAQDKLPSGEKIMDMTIKARGGEAALKSKTNCAMKGKVEVTDGTNKLADGTVEHYSAPEYRYYYIMDLGQFKIEAGCDGDTFWSLSPQGVKVEDGDEVEESKRSNRFNSALHWREYYDQAECTGREEVDGQSSYKVVLTPKVGAHPETLYFSRKTGLPIRFEKTIDSEGSEIPIRVDFLEYRKVDGLQVPTKLRRTVTLGALQRVYTVNWDTIEYDANLPDDRFDLHWRVRDEIEMNKRYGKPKDKKDDAEEK